MARHGFPNVHLSTLRSILETDGPQPRYAIARALVDRVSGVSMTTALAYIRDAVRDGTLQNVGGLLQLNGPTER